MILASILVLISSVGLGVWQLNRTQTLHTVPANGPTMAVLPFSDNSPPGQKQYFSDGITEDIITALTRFSSLRVVSRNTVAGLSNDNKSIKHVADVFGVRYLVSGSVRHDKEWVRIAVRLIDMRDGRLLWTERYDEHLEDIFLLQDRVSRQIVTTLAVRLTRAETQLARSVPTHNMAAYQLVLLGRHELRQRSREHNSSARRHFADAIVLDPDYIDAHRQLGETYLEEALFGWTEWPDHSLEQALALAHRAVALGERDARSLGFLAEVHVRIGNYSKAQTYLNRAFALNPDDPELHEKQGLLHVWNGAADQAIDHLNYVLRYDPAMSAASSHLGLAYYVTGKPEEAISTIEQMIETAPDAHFVHIILTAAYVETGDIDAAKAAAAIVQRRHPFLSVEGFSKTELFSTEAIKRRLRTSLKRAGLD